MAPAAVWIMEPPWPRRSRSPRGSSSAKMAHTACSTDTCHWSSYRRAVEQQVQPGNVSSAQIKVNTRHAPTRACTDQASGIGCKVFAEDHPRSTGMASGRTACTLRIAGIPSACNGACIDVPMHALPTPALALHDTHRITMPGCRTDMFTLSSKSLTFKFAL